MPSAWTQSCPGALGRAHRSAAKQSFRKSPAGRHKEDSVKHCATPEGHQHLRPRAPGAGSRWVVSRKQRVRFRSSAARREVMSAQQTHNTLIAATRLSWGCFYVLSLIQVSRHVKIGDSKEFWNHSAVVGYVIQINPLWNGKTAIHFLNFNLCANLKITLIFQGYKIT